MLRNLEAISLTAIVLVGIGMLALLLAGALGRRLKNKVGGLIIVGVGIEILALSLGCFSWNQLVGALATILAALFLLWCGVSYVIYRIYCARIHRQHWDGESTATGNNCECVPSLDEGKRTTVPFKKDRWWTLLLGRFDVAPTSRSLNELIMCGGTAYYGFYFTWGVVTTNIIVSIICKLVEDKCEILTSEKGPKEDTDGPVRVCTANAIEISGDTATIAVEMAAALNASGGPEIKVSKGPVGVSISWPDAEEHRIESMGTYRWKCVREEREAPG
ncbi:MAG TPA: hypothetical protein G4O01_02140 [Dehalococcoidia bacterium]|jgi:hypothetical protein|nr:hypothetical protein [Dehalococcoidia bacterium]